VLDDYDDDADGRLSGPEACRLLDDVWMLVMAQQVGGRQAVRIRGTGFASVAHKPACTTSIRSGPAVGASAVPEPPPARSAPCRCCSPVTHSAIMA
jgi:hypothetical protein